MLTSSFPVLPGSEPVIHRSPDLTINKKIPVRAILAAARLCWLLLRLLLQQRPQEALMRPLCNE